MSVILAELHRANVSIGLIDMIWASFLGYAIE
jgi:hypothetical protein